jgi:phage gp46-like protein
MDILIQDNGNGAEVVLEGGDLKGDGTLYNAVYLSLFQGDNFSNVFEEYESDNSFEESLNLPITASNLKTVEGKAAKLLEWMTKEKIADSIECSAYGDNENKINVDILIVEPSGNTYSFAVIWKNQKRILKAM